MSLQGHSKGNGHKPNHETFTMRVTEYWHIMPRELCSLHPWRYPKAIWAWPWRADLPLKSLFSGTGMDIMSSRDPLQPQPFHGLWKITKVCTWSMYFTREKSLQCYHYMDLAKGFLLGKLFILPLIFPVSRLKNMSQFFVSQWLQLVFERLL